MRKNWVVQIPKFKLRTRKSQRKRKQSGTQVEKFVKQDLESKGFTELKVDSYNGVDIKGKRDLEVEVKSAQTKTLKKKKNGEYGSESGRLVFKKSDCDKADAFGIVEKKPNGELKLHGYIWAKTLKNFLKNKNTYKTGKSTKLSFKTIKKLPKARMNSKKDYH